MAGATDSDSGECSPLSAIVAYATGNPAGGIAAASGCLAGSTTDDVEAVTNAEDNQTALQLYQAASAQAAADDQFLAQGANYANDTRHAAWSRAEIAYYKAIQNGSVKEVAREKAMRAIEDYYTQRQMTLAQHWEVQAHAAYALHQRAVNESGVADDLVTIRPLGDPVSDAYSPQTGPPKWNLTTNVTYLNGSTTALYSFGGVDQYDSGGSNPIKYPTVVRSIDGSDGVPSSQGKYTRIVVNSPSGSDINQFTYFNTTAYSTTWNRYSALASDLKGEFSTYANNTYPAIEDGRLNASQVLSTETRMFNLGTQAADSGSLYDSVAALAQLGLATPNLNGTGTMTVYYENRQYHGLLLAPQVPNGTWTANTTYNGSAPPLDDSALLATTTGETVHLTGEFRVGAISNQNGGSLNSVNATRAQYQTTNVTTLLEQINDTQRLIAQAEARQAAGGGGGSGSGGGGGGSIAVVGGLAVLALGIVIVLQRD
ncbi:hypothetical protein [Halarchaeum grantii]|uniref:hypothetical protein n=1 Tax=Halarchaeum grantii TaxID=1193105 RepID=UPI00166B814C|nr:hypothetical protein [Halarchaeum grantii]